MKKENIIIAETSALFSVKGEIMLEGLSENQLDLLIKRSNLPTGKYFKGKVLLYENGSTCMDISDKFIIIL